VAVDRAEASLPAPNGLDLPEGREVLVGVRPHDLRTVNSGQPGLPVTASLTEHLGRHNFVICDPMGGPGYLFEQGAIQIETATTVTCNPGERLTLSASPEAMRMFDPETGSCWPAEGSSSRQRFT